MPDCSVVMSAYNCAPTLEEAMRGVLAQRGVDLEFIAIDDASTDDTRAILTRVAGDDARVRVVVRERNLGLTSNLNDGIARATAPLIARIDGDDVWHDPDKLARQVAFLREHGDHALIGTWARLRGEQSGTMGFATEDAAIRKRILIENCFTHSSVVFRTALARELGGYRPGTYCEDYDLWLRIGTRAKFANIGETLMTYTVSTTGINATKRRRQIADCLRAVGERRRDYPNYARALVKWRGLQAKLALKTIVSRGSR